MAKQTKVEIGFGIGQVLSVKLDEEQLADLRKAVETGKGWYAYPGGARRGAPDPEVTAVIEDASRRKGIRRLAYPDPPQTAEDRAGASSP